MSEHEPPLPPGPETPAAETADGPVTEEGFTFFDTIPVGSPTATDPSVPPPPMPSVETTAPAAESPRAGGVLARRTTGWIVAGVLACAVVGLSVALATTSSAPANTASRPPLSQTAPGGGAGGFGGAAGGFLRHLGNFGTIESVSASSFQMTTSSGQSLTVVETPSTTYRYGFNSSSASSLARGDRVAVRGTTKGSTLTATAVFVLPAGGVGNGGAPS